MQAKFYDPNKQEDDFQIRIDRNGQWFHQNTPIERKRLEKLFSTALHYNTKTNEYWLITPHEQGRIQVEDTPFIIIDFTWNDGELSLHSNMDHKIISNKNAHLTLKNDLIY